MGRGVRTLGGKHGDSRQIQSRDEFYVDEDGNYVSNAPQGNDFIPLDDEPNSEELAMADSLTPQPRENPGDPGSSIPGIDAFRDPSTIPGLSGVFRNIYFEYNSNLIKGQDNLEIVKNVSDYMRRNGSTYIFVEGHCDERGPEAYNLALGARRANAVRNMLISEGVSPDNVFTISYGKERPLMLEHHDEAWSQNRRAEFKVYQR
jgi:peptidoglycan-associated lipoprotein